MKAHHPPMDCKQSFIRSIRTWNTVGQNVVDFVREASATGVIPEGINHTLITLIPKVS